MITINIPPNFLEERVYIIDVLFNEFLGLQYNISVSEGKSYEISLENGNKLVINDSFFSKFKDGSAYLDKSNLAQEIIFAKNDFLTEADIPIIYGRNELKVTNNAIICGIDIFSSCFFMLSRWEEYVDETRDVNNRFPATASTAYKNDFLNRPVVNEYVEMLWNMLKFLGCGQKRKERTFNSVLTHDVDILLRFSGGKGFLKAFGHDSLRTVGVNSFKNFLRSKFDVRNDPFNTFDYIMDLSEKLHYQSHFFFMGAQKTKYDSGYPLGNVFMKNLMERIIRRGHVVGFHPGYYTYNDGGLFKREYDYLSQHLPFLARCGRQHFLRFSVPQTWQIWEDNDMEWDSTLSYADALGFRCGTCYEFSVFNILTRQKLKLKERPLIAMDTTFANYQKMPPQKMKDEIKYLSDKVKIYNGNFVFLWHNSSFNTAHWRRYQHIYEEVLKA